MSDRLRDLIGTLLSLAFMYLIGTLLSRWASS